LLSVPAQGGEILTLVSPDRATELDFHSASVLPGGKGNLFIVHGMTQYRLALFANGVRKILPSPPSPTNYPVYSSTGHVIFVRRDDRLGLWAQLFSLSRLEWTGEPFAVEMGATQPSVSRNGTLAFRWGSEGIPSLSRVDRGGKVLDTGRDLPE